MTLQKDRPRKVMGAIRNNTEMEILENPKAWLKSFQEGWLAHFETSGETDWKKYSRPRNRLAPPGPGIDLSSNRLLFISSAGAYLPDTQQPFDASNPFGDYSTRIIPADTPFERIAIAHEHYDHQFVNADPQVLLPLGHLTEMVSEGYVGELMPHFISFSGYHPNVIRVVKELAPAILKIAKEAKADAALLVPS